MQKKDMINPALDNYGIIPEENKLKETPPILISGDEDLSKIKSSYDFYRDDNGNRFINPALDNYGIIPKKNKIKKTPPNEYKVPNYGLKGIDSAMPRINLPNKYIRDFLNN